MRLLTVLMTSFLLAAPPAATAYEPDDTMLKDLVGLNNALRANGVEPNSISWHPVELMCSSLQAQGKAIYNRCRFNAATNQADFKDDTASCNNDSLSVYPDSMRKVVSTNATTGVSTIIQNGVSLQELRGLRRNAYTACMRDLGWKNPSNWQRGRD